MAAAPPGGPPPLPPAVCGRPVSASPTADTPSPSPGAVPAVPPVGVRRARRHTGQHVQLARGQHRTPPARSVRPAFRSSPPAAPGRRRGRRQPAADRQHLLRSHGSATRGASARSAPCASRTSSHLAGSAAACGEDAHLPPEQGDAPPTAAGRLVPHEQRLLHVPGRRHRGVSGRSPIGSAVRSAPYSTPRTLRRTTTGTASTDRSPSAATAASYSWLIMTRHAGNRSPRTGGPVRAAFPPRPLPGEISSPRSAARRRPVQLCDAYPPASSGAASLARSPSSPSAAARRRRRAAQSSCAAVPAPPASPPTRPFRPCSVPRFLASSTGTTPVRGW